MADEPKSDSELVAAICLMLPDDPDRAVGLATVACAAAVLQAGVDDAAAVDGLRAALTSMRENGFSEARH